MYKVYFLFIEKKFQGRLKYIFEDNHSDELIIVFPGFPKKYPKYNYRRTLKESKIDKLFILDDFGFRGSYLWYEHGHKTPEELTSGLIEKIKAEKKYNKIYTAGSSKGGTCAIYFGIKHHASECFASACQYHIGDYLNAPQHIQVLRGMMGPSIDKSVIETLNTQVPQMITKNQGSKTFVHLYYSKDGHTYSEHIVDLISDLQLANIKYDSTIDSYTKHGDNGLYFSKYLKQRFSVI